MSSYHAYTTRDAEEAAIQRFGRIAAKRARQAFAMQRIDIDSLPITDIYDECRDHAYDVLLAESAVVRHDLVDQYLIEVTEVAEALLA